MAAESEDPDSVLSWYRQLTSLRASSPILLDGNYTELFPESEQIFAYRRNTEEAAMVILLNFSNDTVPYDPSVIEGLTPVLSSLGEGTEPGTLRPLEAVIYGP